MAWCSPEALEKEREVVLVGAWIGPEVVVDTEMEWLTWAGGD